MHSSIRRITLVKAAEEGTSGRGTSGRGSAGSGTVAADIYKKKKKKSRKSTKGVEPMEKFFRRAAEAQKEFSDQMLDNHNRSSRKRKDGWVQEGPTNAAKAARKALKVFAGL